MNLLPPPEDEDEDSLSDDESVKNESALDAAPLPPAGLQLGICYCAMLKN